MRNKLALFLVAALVYVPTLAQQVSTVGELDSIQSQTVLMKAKAKLEEEKNKFEKQRAESGGSDGTLPVLSKIINGKATFLYPNKVYVTGAVGDVILGGYTIKRIWDDSFRVKLAKNGSEFFVGFSAVAPVGRGQAGVERGQGGYSGMGIPPQ